LTLVTYRHGSASTTARVERALKAAADFVEELGRAVNTIRETPQRWPMGKSHTRRFLLWRFPFSIIYTEEENEIILWAVAHASGRPEFWTVRLKYKRVPHPCRIP
jgi:hypothetical protein